MISKKFKRTLEVSILFTIVFIMLGAAMFDIVLVLGIIL